MRRPLLLTIGSVSVRFPRFHTGSRSRRRQECIGQQVDRNLKWKIMPLALLDPRAVYSAIDLKKKHPGFSPRTHGPRDLRVRVHSVSKAFRLSREKARHLGEALLPRGRPAVGVITRSVRHF